MSVQSNVDDAVDTLFGTALPAYMAAGGNAQAAVTVILSRMRLSDQLVAQMLVHSANRILSAPPERRPLAEIG